MLVAHDCPEDELADVAVRARHLAETLRRTGTPRDRSTRMGALRAPLAAGLLDNLPERGVGGLLNPSAVPTVVHWDGESSLYADVVLGPPFEGGQGRVHGGVIAGLFDDILSHMVTALAVPAVSGRLTVHYRAPTPTGVPIRYRGTLRSHQGRRILIDGEARYGDVVTATAELLMVVVDAQRFSRYEAQAAGATE